jgi:hypothetical protein
VKSETMTRREAIKRVAGAEAPARRTAAKGQSVGYCENAPGSLTGQNQSVGYCENAPGSLTGQGQSVGYCENAPGSLS